MAFHITGGIGNQRKRYRMGLGETVFGKTAHLSDQLLDECRVDSIFQHAPLQFRQYRMDVAIKITHIPGADIFS